MAAPMADDKIFLWAVLKQVRLADFLRSENGWTPSWNEGGSNLFRRAAARLALAPRLAVRQPGLYLLMKLTSNIDGERERHHGPDPGIGRQKTVILISHRLANVTAADNIYVRPWQPGGTGYSTKPCWRVAGGTYARLWIQQQELEKLRKGGKHPVPENKKRPAAILRYGASGGAGRRWPP